MGHMTCDLATAMANASSVALSTGERTAVQKHFAGCARCRDRARARRAVGAALEEYTDRNAVSPARRERAIGAALACAGQPASIEERRRTPRAWLAVSAAAALIVAAVIWSRGPTFQAGSTPHAGIRLISGSLSVTGEGSEQRLPAGVPLATTNGAEIRAGRASVRPAPGSTIVVASALDSVRLDAGAVIVSVDPEVGRPAPARRFSVVTPRFVVEVTGTVFEVGESFVSVQRGSVRVTAPSGPVLAELQAGDRWSLPAQPAAEQPVSHAEPPTEQPTPAPPAVEERRDQRTPDTSPAPNAAALVAEARRALAARRVPEARALVERALALADGRADRAEAETLRAECELVAGDMTLAGRLYLSVADRYGDLAAGENALFAAATVARKAGRDTAAMALLRRYAERYPSGRFQRQVRARLEGEGAQRP